MSQSKNINLKILDNIKSEVGNPDNLKDVTTKNINSSLPKFDDDSSTISSRLESSGESYPNVISAKQMSSSQVENKPGSITIPSINLETAKHVRGDEKKYEDARSKPGTKESRYKGLKEDCKNIKNYSPTTQSLSEVSDDSVKSGKHPSIKWSEDNIEKIQTADALLYHIYATASREGRELTPNEKMFVERIETEKIDILNR
jgi:hypothetical protein